MGELGAAASWLNDPAVQAGLAPFALALGLGVLLPLFGAARFTGVSIGVAFLVAYALFEGVAPFPPPAAKQKLFYLVAFGLAAGLLIDFLNRPAWLSRAALIGFPLACALWFAWRRLGGSPDIEFLATLAGLWAIGALFLDRLAQVGEQDGALNAGILLIATALGAAVIAMQGASITLALLSGAVAASAGGLALTDFAAWVARGRRRPFGAAAVLGGGGALVALAGIMALYTPQISKLALALLLLVVFADRAARRLSLGSGLGSGFVGRVGEPLALGALAAVAAFAAIGLAYLLAGL